MPITTEENTQPLYSTMSNRDDNLFNDENIQRFDVDTIKNCYGNDWRNFVTNVREVTQPDGSIIKEYVIEDPTVLEQIKPSSESIDSTLPTTNIDDEYQSSKNKFAQIKAKFEQKNISTVMGSPLASSIYSNVTGGPGSSQKQTNGFYTKYRRASDESIPVHRITNNNIYNYNNNNNNNSGNSINSPKQSINTHDSYQRSNSIGTEKSKVSSFKRFESADEADEEVQRIHRQGEELRRHSDQHTSELSVNENSQHSRIQYEILDEDGNPLNINGVQDLIKMSGVHAREVPQPDGSVIKEYVIDDPQLLSKFRSQQEQEQQQSTMNSSYAQQRMNDDEPPPPPPRVPLRPSMFFRQGELLSNGNLSHNIQQIHVLEPQRRYEYLTRSGRRIQFLITNPNSFNGQLVNDTDIRELTYAINSRLPSTSTFNVQDQPPQQYQQQQRQPMAQTSFNLPKPWNPSTNLPKRERIGSDNANNSFQQIQPDLYRPISHGAINQGVPFSQTHRQLSNETTENWNPHQNQEQHSYVKNQRQQNNQTIQTASQFLPAQQVSRSMHSPPISDNYTPVSYQKSTTYPYQGQQQHGVRILNNFNQQRTPTINDQYNRI